MAKRNMASFSAVKRAAQADFARWFAHRQQAAYLQQMSAQRQARPARKMAQLCSRL